MDGIKGLVTTVITLIGLAITGFLGYTFIDHIYGTYLYHGLIKGLYIVGAFYALTLFLTWISTIICVMKSKVKFAENSTIMKWFLFSFFVFPLKASSFIVAPSLGLAAAIVNEDKVYGPFKYYMTNDADFSAYYEDDHVDHAWGKGTNVVDRWFKRTRWLSRNKFYHGLAMLFGKESAKSKWITISDTMNLCVISNGLYGIMWKPTFLFLKLRIKSGWHPAGDRNSIWATVSSGH